MTEIAEAVQNFHLSLKIGEGGRGSVYKGFLRHTWVAIKIMTIPSMQGSQEFQQEVDVLSKVRHPNLITLIGACPEPCTLVYEYIPNGSLEDWLRNTNRAAAAAVASPNRIAMELRSVLAFLHSGKPHSIVHGDAKPGTSYWTRTSNNTTVVYPTDPKGTFGYMDPEFLVTQELTTKFDVYSFGIVLLQLLTRRPAFRIAKEVQRAISAGTLEAILDPLAGEWPYKLAKELTDLALRSFIPHAGDAHAGLGWVHPPGMPPQCLADPIDRPFPLDSAPLGPPVTSRAEEKQQAFLNLPAVFNAARPTPASPRRQPAVLDPPSAVLGLLGPHRQAPLFW
ncbi:hypothetical protein NL676_010628 [Syzygium grande]|nr:hypothetical protein NL676_010628 [Syzygium grande]